MNKSIIYMKSIELSWYDYGLFSFMLGTSVIIGIYFGCFEKKQNTAAEYLLGGRNMSIFPVAMSLIASQISGITVLAVPAYVYKYGSTIFTMVIGIVLACFITAYITLPVFYKLQLTSTYEYLMLRFNIKIRQMASLLYTVNIILYLPIVIYGPALAFAQATPVNLHLVNPIICAICIFYTTIGGLKAVVWTDTLQFAAMVGSMIAVIVMGISVVGGLGSVFQRAYTGERLDIDFDINPTKRDTFWAILIGWTIHWIPQVAINQGAVQKFLSLPSLPAAKKSLLIFGIGAIFCKAASILTGLIIYAKYYDCDPFSAGYVKKDAELLPFYIMDVANKIPGLPGLFIAGVFCASLSTLSAQMNSLSGIIYEDFISRFVSKDITDKQISNILKLIVITIGIISTSLVFVIEKLGSIFALVISLSGITSGPLLGLFLLGMLFPSANSKGAFAGSILSLICMAYIIIGSQLYNTTRTLKYMTKPASIQSCLSNSSLPLDSTQIIGNNDEVPILFRITYYYYTLIGMLISFMVSLPISWLTKQEKSIDKELITPCMQWTMRDKYIISENKKLNSYKFLKLGERKVLL